MHEPMPIDDRPWHKRHPALFWTLFVFLFIMAVAVISAALNPGSGTTAPTDAATGPTVTVTNTVTAPGQNSTATITVTQTKTQPVTSHPAASDSASNITDGSYEVGVDIPAGKYKTRGSDGSNPVGCYVAVLNSSDSSDIRTNNISDGPQTVVVRRGQYLDVAGCKPLTRVG